MYSRDELKQLRVDFWTMFGKRCEVHPLLVGKRKKWLLHRTGISNVALRFDVGRENAVVMIEISHRNERRRLAVFEIFEKYKSLLEEGIPNGLIWEFYIARNDSSQEVCRIYTELRGVDFHRQNQWPDIFNFFIENMIPLENNLMEIKDLVKDEIARLD
jgi:hypothetical protein